MKISKIGSQKKKYIYHNYLWFTVVYRVTTRILDIGFIQNLNAPFGHLILTIKLKY